MIMKKRKGVALLIVLVLSAVIFSTVGLIAVLSENSYKSQSSKLLDNKAFDVAESGANLLINEIRLNQKVEADANFPGESEDLVEGIKGLSVGQWYSDDGGKTNIVARHVINTKKGLNGENIKTNDDFNYYLMKIKCLKAPDYTSGSDFEYIFDVYILGAIAKANISDKTSAELKNMELEVSSRRIIHFEINGIGNAKLEEVIDPPVIGEKTYNNSIFNYSMFAGTELNLQDAAVSVDSGILPAKSDMYGGSIIANKNAKLSNVNIYIAAGGTDKIGKNHILPSYGAKQQKAPEINTTYYKNMFIAFLNGYYPYNGDAAAVAKGYPNTSAYTGILKEKLGISGTQKFGDDCATTTAELSSFFDFLKTDITSPTLTPKEKELINEINKTTGTYENKDNMVFYVSGTDGTASFGSISKYSGVIVTEDNVEFSTGGNGNVGAFLSGGNITFKTNSDYSGVFFAEGNMTMQGNGNYRGIFSCGGTLIAPGNQTFILDKTYADKIPNLSISGGFKDAHSSSTWTEEAGFNTVAVSDEGFNEENLAVWEEVDKETFLNP